MSDIRGIVNPILGHPYEDWDCWRLVRHLYSEGLGIHLDEITEDNAPRVQEVWFRGDEEMVVEPWDVLIMNIHGPLADHLGIVVDDEWFVHTRKRTGVCLERIKIWNKRILQVVRLSRPVAF